MVELLDKIDATQSVNYGGKATMLGFMINNGISVPKGISISADEFFSVINHGEIRETINKFWSSSENDILKISTDIKNFIMGSDITPLVSKTKETLLSIFSEDKKLIFRSSATSEDGKISSFAGQFLRACLVSLQIL